MTYLAAAFVAVWLFVTIYLVIIGWRQHKLEQEMRTLQETLAEQAEQRSAGKNS
jgi:CcmD family protein